MKYLGLLLILCCFSCLNTKHPIAGVYELKALRTNNVKLYIKSNGKVLATDKFFESKNLNKYKGVWELKQDTLVLYFKNDSPFCNGICTEKYIMSADSSEFCYINSDSILACYFREKKSPN
jgi:hypothetical protein